MRGTLPTDFERALRHNQTDAEKRLWHYLRNRNLAVWKFRRQHRVGPYVLDFVCLEAGLAVELDGSQHQEAREEDARRTAYLGSLGLKVLRFWDNAVLLETESVLTTILDALGPSPQPSPRTRGEGVEE
jgi:very-short-patch-repair endonuclease